MAYAAQAFSAVVTGLGDAQEASLQPWAAQSSEVQKQPEEIAPIKETSSNQADIGSNQAELFKEYLKERLKQKMARDSSTL